MIRFLKGCPRMVREDREKKKLDREKLQKQRNNKSNNQDNRSKEVEPEPKKYSDKLCDICHKPPKQTSKFGRHMKYFFFY